MEKSILDFLTKATDLILHSRTTPTKSLAPSQDDLSISFSFSFPKKPKLNEKIAAQWDSQSEKFVALDFYLRNKVSPMKTLAERWLFELTPVSHLHHLRDTIDSLESLNKNLSVLLRTISLLVVTVPLYRINDKEDQLQEDYDLSHSLVFSKDDLPSWSGIPTGSQGQDSQGEEDCQDDVYFTTPGLVLPGRVFTVKVFSLEHQEFIETFPLEKEEGENKIENSPELKSPASPEKGKRHSSAMLTEDSLECSEKDEVFVFDELENTIKVLKQWSTKFKEEGMKSLPKRKRFSVRDELLMKKIIEPTKDDQIADLLNHVQKLRSLSMSIESPLLFLEGKGKIEEEKAKNLKGFVFSGIKEEKEREEEGSMKDISAEFDDLGAFYFSMLKSNPVQEKKG